jgi:hypothetical protein
MKASTIKQRLPDGVTVYRDKPQYPSWPAPVRRFECECGFRIELGKSGRAEIRQAVSHIWLHFHWPQHQRWELRLPERLQRSRQRSRTLKRRPRSKKKAKR